MNNKRIKTFLSTLNFILFFVGFQFATTLFLPFSSNLEGISRTVTIPYRAIALGLSLSVIVINYRGSTKNLPLALKVFLFYWGILIFRMFYDIYFRSDVQLNNTDQLWLYVFGICLPAVFSVMSSYKSINFDKSFYWILGITILILFISIFANQSMLISSAKLEGRQQANLAIDTITFGHIGVSAVILSLSVFVKKRLNFIQRVLVFLFILLGIYCMLRSGSRGPVLALGIVLFFWMFSRSKTPLRGIFILIIGSILIALYLDQILNLMGTISPVMEYRLKLAIYEGNTSERNNLYAFAIQSFKESPIWGKQFAIFNKDQSFIYSHNIILDSLMGLGIIGGAAMIYFLFAAIKKSYFLIRYKDNLFWIFLLLIQQITSNMLSGAFYYNQLLSALIVFLFLHEKQIKNLKYS